MDRRRLWRACYELLAVRVRSPEWAFMNYGLAPAPAAPPLELEPRDEADRYGIALYAQVIGDVPLTGRDVLEVGSGRGGGAEWVARTHRPRTTVGLDVSAAAVALCRRHRRAPGLSFVRGDAEAIPLPDAAVDVVVNVESSHCYPDVERFAAEVARVLRPGGTLLWADFRPTADVPRTLAALGSGGLRLAHHEDVTRRVLDALRAEEERKERLVRAWMPAPVRPLVRRFAAMEGSRGFEAFAAGRTTYLTARLDAPG